MKKSKIAFHLVSWSVAVVAALVILMAVLFVEFVTPRLTASAEVSTIESNVMYEFGHTIAPGDSAIIPSSNRSRATIGYDCNPFVYLNDILIKQNQYGNGDADWFYLTAYSSAQTNSVFGNYYGIYEIGGISFYIGANSTLVGVRLNYNTNYGNSESILPTRGYYAINDVDFSIKINFHSWQSGMIYEYVGKFLYRVLNPELLPDPIVVSSDYYNVTPTAFEAITTAGNFNCTGTIYYGGIWQETFTSISVSAGSTLEDLDVIFLDSSYNTVAGWAEGEWIVRPLSYNEGTFYPDIGDVRIVFSSAGNISGKHLYNLNQIISLPILPTFGDIIDVYQELPMPNVQDGLNYLPSINNLKAVELTNASDFVTSRTDSSGTYYYVPVYFNDTMYNTWHGVTWAYTDDDSRWWLLFSVPTNISYNVRLSYYPDMSHYTELSYFYDPNSDMSPVLSAFVSNYRNTTYGLDNEFQIAYQEGASAGYEDGYSDNNNLISVVWAVFEFPFRILFGTYNTTTGLYDGGLFNFTILGLDIRAFVLSVISVCLIVAIIKLILGSRGGGSNG